MITATYIEMCFKAHQLQEWYKSDVDHVQEGDRYICQCKTCREAKFVNTVKDSDIDYINERDMTDVDPIHAEMVALSGVAEFGAFWDNEGSIWLPSLERILDLLCYFYQLNKNVTGLNWGDSISRFAIKKLSDFTQKSEAIDFNENALAFLYKEKYSKIWENEEWVKC